MLQHLETNESIENISGKRKSKRRAVNVRGLPSERGLLWMAHDISLWRQIKPNVTLYIGREQFGVGFRTATDIQQCPSGVSLGSMLNQSEMMATFEPIAVIE